MSTHPALFCYPQCTHSSDKKCLPTLTISGDVKGRCWMGRKAKCSSRRMPASPCRQLRFLLTKSWRCTRSEAALVCASALACTWATEQQWHQTGNSYMTRFFFRNPGREQDGCSFSSNKTPVFQSSSPELVAHWLFGLVTYYPCLLEILHFKNPGSE